MLERLLNSIGLYTRKQYIAQTDCIIETNDKLMEMTHLCKEESEKKVALGNTITELSRQLNEAEIRARETERINETLTAENDELHIEKRSLSESLNKTIRELKEQKTALIDKITDLKTELHIYKKNDVSLSSDAKSAKGALAAIGDAIEEFAEIVGDVRKQSFRHRRSDTGDDGKE